MGTQGTGRKRSTKKERSTAEDDALNLIAREAEARLAAKRAARAEAREIRMKELERQQKELSDDDERMSVGSRGSVRVEDRDYLEKGSRAASALTAATLTSLGGTSSRRGSGETAITVDAETSIREIKDALAEVEEKYRKAMVSNAQLDNEKNNLMYQVDTLKDSLMELEELLSESHRAYEEKVKDFEREKHAHSVLQFQFNEMKETLKRSEELLNEIRQLRMKQDGLVREISDLQETVEWKDKKIAALERQKEYTDAIRTERDELREEVVKLKDILKKHGIVLGPDLSINGDVGEAEVDGSPGADPAPQPAPDSQTSPTEGNSLLGNTEETQLRSSGEEEVDPEQHEEMFEDAKENHFSSDTICSVAGVSTMKTASDEQPTEEQQASSDTEEDNVQGSGHSKDLNTDINDCSITEAKEIIDCSPEPQGIETSSEDNVPVTETPEGGDFEETSNPDLGETEIKSSSVDTHSKDIRETSNNIFEEQENKQEDAEEINLRDTESCPQQKVTQDVMKESLHDESVPPQQEPENAEEAENDEGEEMSSKSQPQGTAASGKKKRKKRRGKKKGGAHEDKNQQKDVTDKKKERTEKDIELATGDNETATEPDIDGSITKNLKESSVDQVQNEQDMHNKQQILESDSVEVEAVTTSETFSHIETPMEIRVDHVTDEHNKEQSLEAETADAKEAAPPPENSSHVETLTESITDPKKDEQDEAQTSETQKSEEVRCVASPVSEASLCTSDLIDNSKGAENTDDLDKVCASSGTDISTDDSVSHTELIVVDSAKDEVGSVEEMKFECTTNDPRNTSGTNKENTDAESHVPSNDDIANDESDSTNNSEGKDKTSASLSSTDSFIDGLESLPGSEPPSELSADVNSSSNDIKVSDGDPEEANDTVKDDEEPVAETEQESFLPGAISSSHDKDNSELKPDETDKEELNRDLREPEGLVEPESSSHEEKSDSFDSASRTKSTDAVDTEKSLLETEVQDKQLDDKENQTLQCEDQIVESNVEVSSETEEINTIDMSNAPDSPKEASEIGCFTEQDDSTEQSAVGEDPEHEISQNNEQNETHPCPSEEQLHDSSKDKSEDNDSSQPTLQDSDEEDDEDEEGQSFDFDDMDMEMAIASTLHKNPQQEEVEEGVEVMSDEGNSGISGLCQSQSESNENEQDKPGENNDERCAVDGGNQVDTPDEETDTMPHEEAMSEKGENTENVCEKHEDASEEEVVVADEPVIEEGKVLIVEELGDVAENVHQAASLPVEKGLDVIKHESQGEDLVLPKSADPVVTNKKPLQTRTDVKKNSKKGKAKGKEECKMS